MIFALHSTHAKMLSVAFLHHLAQVLVLVCSATSDIRYVRPADSPLSSCPGQPCLTLHEYVEIDNFTNGTTLKFLPGNHTLQQSFSLVNISNVTLKAAFNHSITNIICKNNVTIYCDRVAHLHIVGMYFILNQRGDRSALEFRSSDSIYISYTVFQGSGEVTGRAMRVEYSSEATISMCVFKHLTLTTRLKGGAIYSNGTNLTIHGSYFINNAANAGGAIYAYKSSLLLNSTIYHGNSARLAGGVITCTWECQVDMVGNNTFHNNSCQVLDGGALSFYQSQFNIIHGIAHFHFNEARSGSAIGLLESNTLFSGSVTMIKNKAENCGGALHIKRLYNEDNSNKSSIINLKQLTLLENTARREEVPCMLVMAMSL